MIIVGSKLKIIDNSGAKIVECIKVLGRNGSQVAYAGDIIVASVKKSQPRKKVTKGDIVRVVISTVKKGQMRKNGILVSFGENTGVVVNAKNVPVGSRVLGPVMLELREKGMLKVISMATVAI